MAASIRHDAAGPAVVAIPAWNEAERIAACLSALGNQLRVPAGAVLLANNCIDGTEAIARGVTLPFRLDIRSVVLPPGRGPCRHGAPPGDASRRRTGQPERHCADYRRRRHRSARLGSTEPRRLGCRRRGRLRPGRDRSERGAAHPGAPARRRCAGMPLCRSAGCNHRGALPRSCRYQAAPYGSVRRQPGGDGRRVQPGRRRSPGPTGEDRALVAALARIDVPIRHDPAIRVTVSGRLDGRAPGGMADTMRRRIVQQDEYTDAQLEPAVDAFRRADFRRRVWAAWADRNAEPGPRRRICSFAANVATRCWPVRTAVPPGRTIERLSPVMHRRRVRFAELPRQIDYARELLTFLTAPVIP